MSATAESLPMTGRAPARALSAGAGWAWAATLVLAASLLAVIASPILHGVRVLPEDDAEYYRVIARHIAATGASTFDGQSLTNGYHPLWEAILVLQEKLVGSSFLVTRLIEAAMMTAAFPLYLRACGVRSGLGAAVFLALYGRLVAGLALTGMEVSCLVLAVALLVTAMRPEADPGRLRGLWLGLAAAAAVLARIDAAVFVLPAVVFAPLPRRVRIEASAACAAVGAVYAAYNLAIFGAALPLSSAVKSLGGLQVNHRALAQLAAEAQGRGAGARYLQTFALLALSPMLVALSARHTLGRALAAATVVGSVMFCAKIFLGSSWRIWPWYNFAILFPLVAAMAVLPPRIDEAWAWLGGRRPELLRPLSLTATALAALLLMGLSAKAAVTLVRAPPPSTSRFDLLNIHAAERWAGVLNGRRVAMGDRAGAFAAAYHGGVVQLEGLVNDRAWLAALKRGGDVTPLLCRRGVAFVIAYRPDLGAYATHRMPVMRTALTQYPGPTVTLTRADEVEHIRDRTLFDARGVDEGDDTLYLWRLGGCPR